MLLEGDDGDSGGFDDDEDDSDGGGLRSDDDDDGLSDDNDDSGDDGVGEIGLLDWLFLTIRLSSPKLVSYSSELFTKLYLPATLLTASM